MSIEKLYEKDIDEFDKGTQEPLLTQSTTPKSNRMYWVYVIYGFSVLSNFNAILSTLDFLIKAMPGHNPAFYVGFGMQLFVCVSMIFVIVYGHLFPFYLKNNLMILIQIPILLMIPLGTKIFESSDDRFACYVTSMLLLGLFMSWTNCSVYYQAANYPTG